MFLLMQHAVSLSILVGIVQMNAGPTKQAWDIGYECLIICYYGTIFVKKQIKLLNSFRSDQYLECSMTTLQLVESKLGD